MCISQIRDSIVPEKELISWKRLWQFPHDEDMTGVNCYAYALGITVSKINLYIPGYISGYTGFLFDENEFWKRIADDLNVLGINYRILKRKNSQYIPETKPGEYLIKVFFEENTKDSEPTEFHFIRRSAKGIWFHKPGWTNQPALCKKKEGFSDTMFVYGDDGTPFKLAVVGYIIIKN